MGRGSGQTDVFEIDLSNERRTLFAHTCSHCGLKSREVDFIVGDGIYQCWFANRAECEARHAQLTPEEWIKLPKSEAMQSYSKVQLMLLAMNKDPFSQGKDWLEAAKRVYGGNRRRAN